MDEKANVNVLAESENYAVWVSTDPELDEAIYHIEIGNVTVHLFQDEWDELVGVLLQAVR